jgi:segregation and condensation protein B
MTELARTLEALLFLSPDPVPLAELADAAHASEDEVREALDELRGREGGLLVKDVAGGFALATDPVAEDAARRLLAKPRTPPLTPAQAETLAIVAYLQPASRPEITRIRGVSADSATATLLERGLIEESGRSQFGAVLYRTTPLFLSPEPVSAADLCEAADCTAEELDEVLAELRAAFARRVGRAQLVQGLGQLLRVAFGRLGQVIGAHRLAGEEEQRLERAGQRGHAATSAAGVTPAATVIGPNGSSCCHSASPRL